MNNMEQMIIEKYIRKASYSDLEDIAAVEAACFPPAEAASKNDIAARLKIYPDHFWLMYVRDGSAASSRTDGSPVVANKPYTSDERFILAGFVDGMTTNEPDLTDEMYEHADMHDENGCWQMIFGVNTLPEYRRRGLAGELIEAAISDARIKNRRGLVLTCKDRLIHYYAKFGFKNEGISASVHGSVTWYQMRLTF